MLDRPTPTTLDRVADVVRAILAQNGAAGTDPSPADRLVDAGMTSVDMVNLMLAVETEFDLMIPPGDITPENFRSMASIAAMVERLREDA